MDIDQPPSLEHDDAPRRKGLAGRLLGKLPGSGFVRSQAERLEHRVLGELKHRMDRVEPKPSHQVNVLAVAVAAPSGLTGHSPAETMRLLLEASSEQSREQALDGACMSILRTLVPEEARILAALSDGAGYPLLHVVARPKLGLAGVPMLEYVSNVGRSAGVLRLEMTPVYVRHLAAWGLTESAPEDPAQRVAYEMLETDETVRRVVARITKSGERPAIVRRTLRISDMGSFFWKQCQAMEALPG